MSQNSAGNAGFRQAVDQRTAPELDREDAPGEPRQDRGLPRFHQHRVRVPFVVESLQVQHAVDDEVRAEINKADGLVLDVGGVGYQVQCSARPLDALGGIGAEVLLLTDEHCEPYEKPPLSKAVLKGEVGQSRYRDGEMAKGSITWGLGTLDQEGSMRMSQLAARLLLDRTALSRNLDASCRAAQSAVESYGERVAGPHGERRDAEVVLDRRQQCADADELRPQRDRREE